MLTIAVLGEVEATRDGVHLPLPAGKTSELLARLAVQPRVPVRVDTLVEDLWGEQVDRNVLQAKVSHLRRALGAKDLVRGLPRSYLLDVAPEQVDATRAMTLARTVATAVEEDRPGDVIGPASEGVALFRGLPLDGSGDWAAPHRTGLEEVRWSLVEALAAARVALGAGGEMVGELERLVGEQPLRERLWAALMMALYRAGRQSDALAAYARARRHLVDELGIEPGAELKALEAQVLSQEAPPSHVRRGTRRDPTAPPMNLPGARGTLVGRDAERRDAAALLVDHPVVTLVGPAGVGKTRLALEVARADPPTGGAWMVRLDSVPAGAGTSELVRAVCHALHVGPDPAALHERLAGAPTLLVLDNCEHVFEAAATLAGGLTESSPGLRVLATSQVPLGVAVEQVLDVAPLDRDSAVELFEQRMAEATRRGDLAAHPDLVGAVCASLDGLPLAIELAAARVRSLPLDEIARRLDDRFTLLRNPSHPSDRRHALEAALSWSYDLLFPDDQLTLQALACFHGGASLPAVETVVTSLGVPRSAVADTLGRLVDRSLVTFDATRRVPRYRLLDSIRAYARVRLAVSGAEDTALAAHASWYADRADECATRIRGDGQATWLDFVRAERADVDAALAWSATHDRRTGERIALGLAWAWAVLGDGSVGAARLRTAVGDDAASGPCARAALVAAWLDASAGNLGLAHLDLDRATSLQTNDRHLEADLAWTRGFVAIQDGRPLDVTHDATTAATAYRALGDTWGEGAALLVSAYGHLMQARPDLAGATATEAVVLIEQTGDAWGLLHANGILAGIAEATGQLEDAARAFAAAADAATRLGFAGQAALHLASHARAMVALGDPGAARVVDHALDAAAAVGDGRVATALRVHAAQLARAAGDTATAAALLETNARWYAMHGGGDREAVTEVLQHSLRDDREQLAAVLNRKLDPAARQAALDAAARLAAAAGDPARAAELSAQADAVHVAAPDFVLRVDRVLSTR